MISLIGYAIGNGFGSEVGNDPHFFLPLTNGDHMCFSIQGQPDFIFNLINDKYIQLNGKFVLPDTKDNHMFSNVTTFLGSLGLTVTDKQTGNITIIEISAEDHSVAVGNSITVVKDTPITVNLSTEGVTIKTVDQSDASEMNEPNWIIINTNLDFDMKIAFYKKHLNMLLTRTSGLTKHAHGLIGM